MRRAEDFQAARVLHKVSLVTDMQINHIIQTDSSVGPQASRTPGELLRQGPVGGSEQDNTVSESRPSLQITNKTSSEYNSSTEWDRFIDILRLKRPLDEHEAG
jgi:hypothetical protein